MTRWTSRHLHLASGAVSALDRVITQVAAPVAEATGQPWFFLRYWQGGPHVRLRVAGLDDHEVVRFDADLTSLLTEHAAPRSGEPVVEAAAYAAEAERQARGETGENRTVAGLLAPGVHVAHYDPEIERYGGAGVMAMSEHLFARSSQLVRGLLPVLPDLASRRMAALRLTEAAARPLGPVVARAVFYEIGRRSWAAWAASYGHDAATIAQLAHASSAPPPEAFASRPGWLVEWTEDLAALVTHLSLAGVPLPGAVISSHVHMTHNRLGLTILDELRTYALLARTFPAPPEAVPDLGLAIPA